MKIESLNDLNKLMKLCRSQGIESIKIDNVEFRMGDVPLKVTKTKATIATVNAAGVITEHDKIETDGLTPEQLLMWSATAVPDGETA